MHKYGKTYNIFKRSEDGKEVLHGVYGRPEFEYLADLEWIFQEKIDGTNIRVIFDENGHAEVRGRSNAAQVHTDLLANILRGLPSADDVLAHGLANCCLYGEGYGPGIQKGGGNYRKDKGFILFDVFNSDSNAWYRPETVNIVGETLGIDVVPVIGVGKLSYGVSLVYLGLSSTFGDFYAEGLIARPAVPLYFQDGTPVKCKIKHRDLFKENQ